MAEPLNVDTNSAASTSTAPTGQTGLVNDLAPVVEEVGVVDGPLAALEVPSDNLPKLTYPSNLGNDPHYRYAMRILIYRQVRDVNASQLISPNSFDRAYKASQEGKINTDVIGPLSLTAIGGAALAGGAFNIIKEFAKNGKAVTSAIETVTGTLGSAVQVGAAGFAASALDQGGQLNLENVETQSLAYINLYMPEGLNFVDRQDYDAVSVTDALGNLGALATGNAAEIATRLAEGARVGPFTLLGQNVTDLALYNSGYALNPQLQVLFKGSKNREFVFTFRFIPRNRKEAATVESIVRTLRYHAAPNFETTDSGTIQNSRYFIPPSQFEIEFLVMSNNAAVYNDKLPRIAKCVLSNIDVDFAPQGQFAAYEDFQPIETRMQLTFTETTILTKQDIKNGY